RVGSDEADGNEQPPVVVPREAQQQGCEQPQNERTCDIDDERPIRERRSPLPRRPLRHDKPGIRTDEAAHSNHQIFQQALSPFIAAQKSPVRSTEPSALCRSSPFHHACSDGAIAPVPGRGSIARAAAPSSVRTAPYQKPAAMETRLQSSPTTILESRSPMELMKANAPKPVPRRCPGRG